MSELIMMLPAKKLGKDVLISLISLFPAVMLPFVVHLIPNNGVLPYGALFLPIFYAPLVVSIKYNLRTALLLGLFAPIVNYMLTGHPASSLVLVMTLELVVFSVIVNILKQNKYAKFVSGGIGYLITKCFSMITLMMIPSVLSGVNPIKFALQSIQNGIAGVFLLTFFSFILNFNFTKGKNG